MFNFIIALSLLFTFAASDQLEDNLRLKTQNAALLRLVKEVSLGSAGEAEVARGNVMTCCWKDCQYRSVGYDCGPKPVEESGAQRIKCCSDGCKYRVVGYRCAESEEEIAAEDIAAEDIAAEDKTRYALKIPKKLTKSAGGLIEIVGLDLTEAMKRSAVLTHWTKLPGDHVEYGEVVAELEVWCCLLEILAPATGTLEEYVVRAGMELYPSGTHLEPVVLGLIKTSAERAVGGGELGVCDGMSGNCELFENTQCDGIFTESECATRNDCEWMDVKVRSTFSMTPIWRTTCVKLNPVCNEGGRSGGQCCDTRWDHVSYWETKYEYCTSEHAGYGCTYGYHPKPSWQYCDQCAKRVASAQMARCT